MGVQVELPTLRRKRLVSIMVTPTKGSKQMDHESWQWGAFENLSMDNDYASSHPTRLSTNCGADAATLADSPDGSMKHLISPSTTGSSPGSPSSPLATISPPFGGGMYVDPFGSAEVSPRRRLRKGRSDGCKDSGSMSFACNDEFRPSRWDSGRWSAAAANNNSFEEGNSVNRPRGNQVCKCAAGLTADVAVVCCCPFSVLHLLAIAFIKLPAAVMSRTVTRIKQKIEEKRQRVAVHEEEDKMTTPATSYPPSRSRSYEGSDVHTWAPALSFGDQKQWRDYFDSPDATGAWSTGEPLRAKS